MYIFFIICLQKHARSFARVCKLQCACRESNPGHKRGLYVAATLQALLFMRSLWICLSYFLFLQALRPNPLMSLWGAYLLPAASYFLFPIVKWLQTGVSVSLASVNWLFGLVAWFSLRVQEVRGSVPRTALASFYREMLQEASGTSFKRACLDACFASPRFFFAMFRSSPPAMPC